MIQSPLSDSPADDDYEEAFSSWPAWPGFQDNECRDPASKDFQADHLLWTDPTVLNFAGRNSLRVFEGMVQIFNNRRPLGVVEQEFMEGALLVGLFGPHAFVQVWHDPRVYQWTRQAFLLMGQLRTGVIDPKLPSHLDQFKLFVLACQQRSGEDFPLVRPVRLALPLAIPATRWSLVGPGNIDLLGLEDDKLLVRHGGIDSAIPLKAGQSWSVGNVTLCEAPVAHHAGYELPLHPHVFNLPDLTIGEPVLRAGLDFQRQHVPLLEQTLAAIARFAPSLFVQFRRLMRLAAIKPLAWGGYDDFSEPHLPGSFIASVIHHPLEMADHLIHEFQHNRLSLIEELGPLFASGGNDNKYYSPWRDKPRGLYGIYHGVYVFVAVCRFWLAVHQNAELSQPEKNYVVDRLLRLPRQLDLALGVLQRHAQLTPLGKALLHQLAKDVDHLHRQVKQAKLPADAPALQITEDGAFVPQLGKIDGKPLSVMNAIREHVSSQGLILENLLEGFPFRAPA